MTDSAAIIGRRLRTVLIVSLFFIVSVSVVLVKGIVDGVTVIFGLGLTLPCGISLKCSVTFVSVLFNLRGRPFSEVVHSIISLITRSWQWLLCFIISLIGMIVLVYIVSVPHEKAVEAILYGSYLTLIYILVCQGMNVQEDDEFGPGLVTAYSVYRNYFKYYLPMIQRSILKYEKENGVSIPVRKLFVLIPTSGYVPDTLEVKTDTCIKVHGSLEELVVSICGTKHRTMNSTVYEVTDVDDLTKTFYCVAEGVAAALTLYELKRRKVLSTEQMRRELLVFYRTLKCLLENDYVCRYSCVLVPYDDRKKQVSSVLKDVVERERCKIEKCLLRDVVVPV